MVGFHQMERARDKYADEIVAVLLALCGANGTRTVTCHRLFEALPRCLREKWSEHYLRTVVLDELTKTHLVEMEREGYEIHYTVTQRGKQRIRTYA